jgi:hypothetical protein
MEGRGGGKAQGVADPPPQKKMKTSMYILVLAITKIKISVAQKISKLNGSSVKRDRKKK